MKVNRSAYYAYARHQTYQKIDCTAAVKECFDFNRRRYGSRRIAASLKIGRSTVRKVMRREGFASDSTAHLQATDDRFKASLADLRESFARCGKCACRLWHGPGWRYYLSAIGGRKNAIIHTDQGSQYAAVEYRRLLYIGGFRQSMSRKGKGSR